MPSPTSTDRQIKKNYQLIYFKRNFRMKIMDCLFWNLDKSDIELMIESWKIKAEKFGKEGIKRYEEALPEIRAKVDAHTAMPGKQWKEIMVAKGLRST